MGKRRASRQDARMRAHLILYIRDQLVSARFYARALDRAPSLDVPGMTEFALDGAVLGLMPEASIKRLLGGAIDDPATARGIPRAELYLRVANAEEAHARALAGGARELSPVRDRDWGDRAGYVADPDGHVLAFAQPSAPVTP